MVSALRVGRTETLVCQHPQAKPKEATQAPLLPFLACISPALLLLYFASHLASSHSLAPPSLLPTLRNSSFHCALLTLAGVEQLTLTTSGSPLAFQSQGPRIAFDVLEGSEHCQMSNANKLSPRCYFNSVGCEGL